MFRNIGAGEGHESRPDAHHAGVYSLRAGNNSAWHPMLSLAWIGSSIFR